MMYFVGCIMVCISGWTLIVDVVLWWGGLFLVMVDLIMFCISDIRCGVLFVS